MNLSWEQISAYTELKVSEEPEPLRELRRFTRWNTSWYSMICSPAQGRFLSFISRLLKPKKILELGTFTGYSAACLVEGLDKDGMLITLDYNPETHVLAREFFQKIGEPRIHATLADIPTWFMTSSEKNFDLIFIDADKEQYPLYFEQSLLRLRKGGVIIIDNVLWKGWVIDNVIQDPAATIIQSLTTSIIQRKDLLSLLVPIRDGMLVCYKN